jgi:hypothetical protein
MNQRTKHVGLTLALMAMAFFAGWPFWSWLNKKAVSSTLRARTESLVEKNPQLQPAWQVALEDDVLTWPEAKIIVQAAGEKIDPQE